MSAQSPLLQRDAGVRTPGTVCTAPRFSIGKVRISAVTMAETLRLVQDQARSGTSAYICVANVRVVIMAQKDADFCSIQNNSFLTIPDGMPLVWYGRLAGVPGLGRVTGPDLVVNLLGVSAEREYSHYFYGDTKETLSKVCRVIGERYPGTVVKGTCSPPFRALTDGEVEATVREINWLRPTFVWVGLGAPKQERFMAEVAPRTDGAILVGVGAAFRFLIGQYKHPPSIIQKCGLEGVCWRFLSHPIREARWYAYHVPAFGWLTAKMLARRLSGKSP